MKAPDGAELVAMGPASSVVGIRVWFVMSRHVSLVLKRMARRAHGRAAWSPVMLQQVAVFVAKK